MRTQIAKPRLEAHSCSSTYLVFGGMFVPVLLVAVYVAAFRKPHDWEMAAIVLSVLIFIIIWIRFFRIVVSNGIIHYRSLFGGNKCLALGEIRKAEIKIGGEEAFGPFYRLILYPSEDVNKTRIVINMKVFSREDVNALLDILGPKLKGQRRLSIFERTKK